MSQNNSLRRRHTYASLFWPKSHHYDSQNAANTNMHNSPMWQSDANVALPTLLRVCHHLQSHTDSNTRGKWTPMARWICLSQKLSPKPAARQWMEECTSLSDNALRKAKVHLAKPRRCPGQVNCTWCQFLQTQVPRVITASSAEITCVKLRGSAFVNRIAKL